MENNRWLVYAMMGAVAASLINVFARLGTRDMDSDLQTAIRSIFQVAFVCAFCGVIGSWRKLHQVDGVAVVWAAAAGIAGGLSWIFVFRAIALADVSKVAPIDKLSLPLGIVLTVILLGERPTRMNWLGIALVVFGAYLATARKAPADVGKGLGPQSATTIGATGAAPVDSGASGGGQGGGALP